MTTQGARQAPARAASFFPLWCKGDKRSRGVPRHQAKVAVPVQRDQDQEDYEAEVTMEPHLKYQIHIIGYIISYIFMLYMFGIVL